MLGPTSSLPSHAYAQQELRYAAVPEPACPFSEPLQCHLGLSLHALCCRMYQDVLGITDPAPDVVVSPTGRVLVCIAKVTAVLKLIHTRLSRWAAVELAPSMPALLQPLACSCPGLQQVMF